MTARALHSRQQKSSRPPRHEWLRDTTVWLAIALCVATAMVLVTEVSGARTPTPSARVSSLSALGVHPGATSLPSSPSPTSLVTTTTLPEATTTTLAHRSRHSPPSSAVSTPHSKAAKVVLLTPPDTAHAHQPATSEADERWNGNVSFPSLVSSSTSFTTSGGTVRADVGISNNVALQAVLRCASGGDAATGKTAISVDVNTAKGPCTLAIHLPSSEFHVGTSGLYDVDVQFLTATPAAA